MKRNHSEPDALRLARTIRGRIVDKGLKAGSRLPTHAELCRQFGVGVRRLREALSILRQEGLVETRRRGGTIVSEPALEVLREPIRWHLTAKGYTFDDLMEARAVVESVVAAQAARRRTARDLLRMLEAIERLEEIPEPVENAEQADEDFHQAVLHAAHNPVLLIFGQLIAGQFREKMRQRLCTATRHTRRSAREHRDILRQIQNHRPEEARKRMHEHVLRQRLEMKDRKPSPRRRPRTRQHKATI